MILTPLRRLTFLCLICALGGRAQAAEPAIIAKARAYLGSEAALNAVTSVHFIGNVVSTDAADPTKQSRAVIEIMVQKPDRQRVIAKSEKTVETTVLDGYEGWQRTVDVTNPKNYREVVFKPDAVKRLRAQAWENISFFRGSEGRGGRIEEQGTKTIDGLACQKLAFIYAPNIIFYRYFDPATGRLVQTETEDGGITLEEGEVIVKGVKYPKAMKMMLKGAKGQTQAVSITFDSITVNETFPAALFRIASPGSE
jgi:outer membrane lipoprotein-sorting protein